MALIAVFQKQVSLSTRCTFTQLGTSPNWGSIDRPHQTSLFALHRRPLFWSIDPDPLPCHAVNQRCYARLYPGRSRFRPRAQTVHPPSGGLRLLVALPRFQGTTRRRCRPFGQSLSRSPPERISQTFAAAHGFAYSFHLDHHLRITCHASLSSPVVSLSSHHLLLF